MKNLKASDTDIEAQDKDDASHQTFEHLFLEEFMEVDGKRKHILRMQLQKKMEEDSKHRKTMVSSGDRSAKIRTYNYPQGRVTEHRIGLTKYNLQVTMGGDIQEFIDELQLAENAEKLKEGSTVDG